MEEREEPGERKRRCKEQKMKRQIASVFETGREKGKRR